MSCFATHLSCWACQRRYDLTKLINLCECGKPLKVEYDLAAIRHAVRRDDFAARPRGLWRWRELLPLPEGEQPVALGEGDSPLINSEKLARELRIARILIKDEAVNPTGSFKARGMTAAVTMARRLGAKKLAVPSAGNAGGALAAYAAAAGIPSFVFMPRDVPAANRLECELSGANVTLVDGLINDCGRIVAERKAAEGWFDVSTLKEPYRVEGKKTLGLEIAEQLGWTLPDVIVYPTGGGTGLIGMSKAFDEMELLGWIGSKRPRFVAVQATGCAPIIRAFERGAESSELFENAATVAAGLRVPKAVADFVILRYLRSSGGTALAIDDAEMIAAAREMSAKTGICACPEGGACLAAARRLADNGWIKPHETILLFNTGSGLKYSEAFSTVRQA
jgi:threonine synthase